MGQFTTDFLVAKSTVVTGAGTVFNISGNYYEYNQARTPQEADALALISDWGIVLQDLNTSFVPALKKLAACSKV